ncbi:uncharacterized protein LOC132702623 isoform X2 [Cylas formicarius]|uniref:uncharacterized protein LOC132702623 isoform X2 n=1 Tax=Cylas formicarius TaxID=197179 RepID=UPI002958B554|nr:uncharacterized protein LOC132702623 isoform X2 [Cylas formicarius]
MFFTGHFSLVNGGFDLDQNAFSPTELDDSFMHYYRYPPKPKNDAQNMTETKVIQSSQSTKKVDFSKPSLAQQSAAFLKQPKPKGTDDGFKGETAQVGNTIVRVANQIVSGKPLQGNPPEPAEECEQLLAKFDPYRRRGSKSLPASPLASPKSQRRVNKYFTSPYVETDKSKGWILSNLLARREISQSMGFIHEENKAELERASSSASVDNVTGTGKQRTHVYTPKPSELREMNFWSPTSM